MDPMSLGADDPRQPAEVFRWKFNDFAPPESRYLTIACQRNFLTLTEDDSAFMCGRPAAGENHR